MRLEGSSMADKNNHILHLYEYQDIPEEIVQWKDDEDITSMSVELIKDKIPNLLCIGTGTYKTSRGGEIYLCALINPENGVVVSYAIGVHRSAELVGKALSFLQSDSRKITLRSSRNPLYRSKIYFDILKQYGITAEYTLPGTRGMVASVSTFFSQLMRKKGSYEFVTWQDAVDWLEKYISVKCSRREADGK